jgi:CDP-glycerol glycerophosphotransferase
MIKLSYILDRIRDVKPSDYLSVFPMTAAFLMKPFYKKKYAGAWLVCEEPAEARDNGYHFFKYMCEKQPQQKCFYAIKQKSVDAKKLWELGETIEYGSIRHWLAYFLCEYNISSQKGGKPNAPMCAFMEMNGIFKPQNVFLQHGITKDHAKWLYADKCKFKYFITAAIPEDQMIREDYGYPEGIVQLTGFPRYDALDSTDTKKNRVLIMPTWRYWFNLKSKGGDDVKEDFLQSDYLKKWLAFLNDQALEELADKYNLEIIFFLHRNMQRYIAAFSEVKKHINIASWKKYDIQKLIRTSAIMVTDYSSVYFDMIYMEKPILFYQFDEVEYRKYQYQEGWFDYHNNVFSDSYSEKDELINKLKDFAENKFIVDDNYLDGCRAIFKYLDTNNSKRIYELLSRH